MRVVESNRQTLTDCPGIATTVKEPANDAFFAVGRRSIASVRQPPSMATIPKWTDRKRSNPAPRIEREQPPNRPRPYPGD